MIAQVVFDLPLEGPFDYLIPENLASQIKVGARVKVYFGPRRQMGFVVGLIEKSTIPKLKPVYAFVDEAFNALDLTFAREFSAYYGCSLGEALAASLRNKKDPKPSVHRDHKPKISLHICLPDAYVVQIQKIIDLHTPRECEGFLVLVPDAFRAQTIAAQLKTAKPVKIGTRSSVFEADAGFGCVIMVDDEDASYKQEQTPMYETRQVLLTRAEIFGFDVAFIGVSPSVELMHLIQASRPVMPLAKVVDLTNYKYLPGLISPPVKDGLDAALKTAKKSLLVLNRKGAYRLTRCVDCGEILKCRRCDSPLYFSKSEAKFLCRHCTYTAPGETVCPQCHKPSWRSQGIGVEQLQTELKKLFPQARIVSFERHEKSSKDNAGQKLADFDILITTQAVLRFQGQLKAETAAFIDFDAELNRMDMRSGFNAFRLALHVAAMSLKPIYIQTRNPHHYVLQSLISAKTDFYDEEFKLRQEFGFSPFKHWVKIAWRAKNEKFVRESADHVYNELNQSAPKGHVVTAPLADAVGRKRDQFRVNVMVQGGDVVKMVAFIKGLLAKTKRQSRVIITLNIDP